MDLYGQEPEVQLLSELISELENTAVIDVGAERGSFAAAMLGAGASAMHVIEPEPNNVSALRDAFSGDARVSVHEYAISSVDGEVVLHKSVTPDGELLSFGHTLLERPAAEEIAWNEAVVVAGRSLESLIAAGVLPKRVGILKIDTEGNDLAVIHGLGLLDADVIMVEHWVDLPRSLGPCPWTTADMVAALSPRGFSHFAFIVHTGEFRIVKWDDGDVALGGMGNLIFLHDRVLGQLAPVVLRIASRLADVTLRFAEERAEAAAERLVVIEELARERELLQAAADERLAVIERLHGGA